METRTRKPDWIRARLPMGPVYEGVRDTVRRLALHTVCEEAACPNIGECWGEGTATIMLLGDTCTRGCRFCDVKTAKHPPPPDPDEPRHVAEAVAALGLRYLVLTCVDRDDLPDGGADHFARTLAALRVLDPGVTVECLVGDFGGDGDALGTVVEAGPEVLAHNVETVERLQRTVRDPRCGYRQSLEVLAEAKRRGQRLTKSSVMIGLGEGAAEVISTLQDLRAAGVDFVTLGQYLRPSHRHLPVAEYVHPDVFDAYADVARGLGFAGVASAPMVRSSHRAGSLYASATKEPS